MRSAVLDEVTALQWRSRRLLQILRAWKEVASRLSRSKPSFLRVQSLRSDRFFREWLKSYRLLRLAARMTRATQLENGLRITFEALAKYHRLRREKDLLRRKAQRYCWRRLLRYIFQGFMQGVCRAQQCEAKSEKILVLKARSLEEQLFCFWQNMVDFTRRDRACELGRRHLQTKAFQGFKRYHQQRHAKVVQDQFARTHRCQKMAQRTFASMRIRVQMRQQVFLQQHQLEKQRQCHQLRGFIARWRSWTWQWCQHIRQKEKTASCHRMWSLCRDAFQLWSFRCNTARESRHRLVALESSLAQEVLHLWLLQWHSAVTNWREDQRKDRKALVQWYVVLVSFTLKSWQSWSLKRQAKKRRQEEASRLFLTSARRWSLAALFRCHEERVALAQQAAEEQWELLAQKRATLVVAAASHWRQKVYLRSKRPSYFLSNAAPELSFEQEVHLSLTPTLSDWADWPSPI